MKSPQSRAQILGSRTINDLLDFIVPFRPEMEKYRGWDRKFPQGRETLRRTLIRACLEEDLDPLDPYLPYPKREDLGEDGISVGLAPPWGQDFFYDVDELPLGAFFCGAPGSGKTTATHHFLRQAVEQGVGALVPDLRGDSHDLAGQVPGGLLIPVDEDRCNPFAPPEGVPMRKWLPVVIARFTRDLGLQLASQSYVTNLVDCMVEQCDRSGTIPTVLDFFEILKSQKPRPRSSTEGYWERVMARMQAFVSIVGERVLGVQKGFPVTQAVEDGRLVVLDLRTERWVADLITSLRLYSLYYRRLYSENAFGQKPVIVLLDEQRSLIRSHDHEDHGIPDIELLFSRSRALGISFLVAEQQPSQVSPALLNACRLRLAFNTPPPELFFVCTKLLGLNPEQAKEVAKLPVGTAICRLAGSRIPQPFRVNIPAPPEP